MSSVFDLFGTAKTAEVEKEQKARLNSEMDDMQLPPDAEFPSSRSLLDLTTSLDKKIESLEEQTPLAVRPDTPDLPEADLGEELLSVTSDVNLHSDQIGGLTGKVSAIESQIGILPGLDSSSRKLAAEVAELKRDMSDIKIALKSLTQSMNASQTAVAQKIADVERRAATKQLQLEPSVDTSLIPPAEVELSRETGAIPGSSADKGKMPARPVLADLTDF